MLFLNNTPNPLLDKNQCKFKAVDQNIMMDSTDDN